MPPQLNDEIIQAAIEGYEQQRNRIDEKIRELRAIQSGRTSSPAPAGSQRGQGRRRLSPEARARIAAAQKARWAKARGESDSQPAARPKKKRRLSKEGRARIIAATKARWAKVRAAKEQGDKKAAARKTSAA